MDSNPSASTEPPSTTQRQSVSFNILKDRRRSRSGSRSQSVESVRRIQIVDNTDNDEPNGLTHSPPELVGNSDSNGGEGSSTVVPSTDASLEREDKLGKRKQIREKVNQRKYAKWSEEARDQGKGRYRKKRKSTLSELVTNDNGLELEVAYDVLYENQRGTFICGIALFSSKALLNFDPSPWTNQFGKISFVNVNNAQLPDPSWRWDWKSWHVDMDHDVDDGGWSYSFSFSPIFSWHGHHIFFNSFVRRRRWIRKRIRYLEGGVAVVDDDWSKGAASGQRSTLYRLDSSGTFSTDEMGEIRELSTLMQVLKGCRLDREKLDAVTSFLKHGGNDRQFLPDSVPQINKLLIFHESRRRLHDLLKEHDLLPSQTSPMAAIFALPPVVSPPPLDKDLPTPIPGPDARSYFPTLPSEASHTHLMPGPYSPTPISPKTAGPSNRPPSIASSVDEHGQVKDKDHLEVPGYEASTSDASSMKLAELTYSSEAHIDEAGDLAAREAEARQKMSKREKLKHKTSGIWKHKGKGKEPNSSP
ncbi:hypothetical protein BJ508DRAFT_415943 [Ascobolus immersus RN42]|uniref:Uncharacterized protein n=1 Tax=Ascobolus immersus RN42 TaxID=1160509 RepID=A0A3N4I0H4_ASCIM|nr:hypothetical protein BJ508DRAFT_415943 [Ascobolus immersus RN42]